MEYDVNVYVLKGVVRVDGVEARDPKEAEKKAVKKVETAEAGFHGNYPTPDQKYLAVIIENRR